MWRQRQEIYLDKYSVDKLIKMGNLLSEMFSQMEYVKKFCAFFQCNR